jgi:DNA-binding PadR family transcriptional regulator
MAGQETRMLLLGAVALFEPVNGYQIRRELLSWQVDRWAHTNPGSIYHGLTALSGQGFLARHDLVDGGREVAVYELTDDGRAELRRLMIEALETVNPYERSGFTVAFSMLPLLDRRQVVRSLTARRVELERTVAEFGNAKPGVAPPHATRSMLLWLDLAVAELAWLRETIEEVKGGTLAFAPGDKGWTPPDDDPGWQMSADRERYRALLGR